VQQLPEQRIGAQPVGIVVGIGLRPQIGAMQPRDGDGSGWLLRDEVARDEAAGLGDRQDRVGQRLLQVGDQPVLGLARQRPDIDLKRGGQPDQQ
jgi:hypothetical protein